MLEEGQVLLSLLKGSPTWGNPGLKDSVSFLNTSPKHAVYNSGICSCKEITLVISAISKRCQHRTTMSHGIDKKEMCGSEPRWCRWDGQEDLLLSAASGSPLNFLDPNETSYTNLHQLFPDNINTLYPEEGLNIWNLFHDKPHLCNMWPAHDTERMNLRFVKQILDTKRVNLI